MGGGVGPFVIGFWLNGIVGAGLVFPNPVNSAGTPVIVYGAGVCPLGSGELLGFGIGLHLGILQQVGSCGSGMRIHPAGTLYEPHL